MLFRSIESGDTVGTRRVKVKIPGGILKLPVVVLYGMKTVVRRSEDDLQGIAGNNWECFAIRILLFRFKRNREEPISVCVAGCNRNGPRPSRLFSQLFKRPTVRRRPFRPVDGSGRINNERADVLMDTDAPSTRG